MLFDDDDPGEPDLTPEQWEMCADQFMLMIERMIDEGFKPTQILAGITFVSADLAQEIADRD